MSPSVNISAIAALGKASTPSTPTSTGRPQLTGPRSQQQPPRPRKERVVGETPFYRREDRETLWDWIMDNLGWYIGPIVNVFGEEAVKAEVLPMWHTDIHRMATLVFDFLVIEYIRAEAEDLEMFRKAAIDKADRNLSHYRADMTAVIEYKEDGVNVNSVEIEERGMSPRARRTMLEWLKVWLPNLSEATGEKLIDRRANRRDLQIMYRFMTNMLWFARVMTEIKLRLAVRTGNDKIKKEANKELVDARLQEAASMFYTQMKSAREADRTEMEANNNPATSAARRRTA